MENNYIRIVHALFILFKQFHLFKNIEVFIKRYPVEAHIRDLNRKKCIVIPYSNAIKRWALVKRNKQLREPWTSQPN